MYLNFAFAVTRDAVFVIYVKTEGRRASEILSVPMKLMIVVILNPILSFFDFQKQMYLNSAFAVTRDAVFCDLRGNGRS